MRLSVSKGNFVLLILRTFPLDEYVWLDGNLLRIFSFLQRRAGKLYLASLIVNQSPHYPCYFFYLTSLNSLNNDHTKETPIWSNTNLISMSQTMKRTNLAQIRNFMPVKLFSPEFALDHRIHYNYLADTLCTLSIIKSNSKMHPFIKQRWHKRCKIK